MWPLLHSEASPKGRQRALILRQNGENEKKSIKRRGARRPQVGIDTNPQPAYLIGTLSLEPISSGLEAR